jgi:hypothetical protein
VFHGRWLAVVAVLGLAGCIERVPVGADGEDGGSPAGCDGGACPDAALACADRTDAGDCAAAGCAWWDGACHDGSPPDACDQPDAASCAAAGCAWSDGRCHEIRPLQPYPCERLAERACSARADCRWDGRACSEDPGDAPCGTLDEDACGARAGCMAQYGADESCACAAPAPCPEGACDSAARSCGCPMRFVGCVADCPARAADDCEADGDCRLMQRRTCGDAAFGAPAAPCTTETTCAPR